jgi:hypothetical protein
MAEPTTDISFRQKEQATARSHYLAFRAWPPTSNTDLYSITIPILSLQIESAMKAAVL